MRSMNALVVKAGHVVPAAVARQLEAVSHIGREDEGTLWVWETNISPLWARHGVADLQEEVVIAGWLLTLPRADFQLIRCGEELGCLGEWENHPFRRKLDDEYMRIAREYADQCQEATPDAEGRLWSRGHPAHIGWYLANPTRTNLSWRYWNGKNWSVCAVRGMTTAQAAGLAEISESSVAEKLMWWSDYWPEGLPLNRTLPPSEDTGAQPVLDKPAKVGNVVFKPGAAWSTVIGEAQCLYERDEHCENCGGLKGSCEVCARGAL